MTPTGRTLAAVALVASAALAGCSALLAIGNLPGISEPSDAEAGDATSADTSDVTSAGDTGVQDAAIESDGSTGIDADAMAAADAALDADAGAAADAGLDADAGMDADAHEGFDAAPVPCTDTSTCPGSGSATATAGCAGTCTLSCVGENYDVNGNPSDGCEVPDVCPTSLGTQKCPVDDHKQSVATGLGSFTCDDAASVQDIIGAIPSDTRTHVPSVDGFDTVAGAAPDYFQISALGGSLCNDDANFSLQMNVPTAQLACYELHLVTDAVNQSCTTDATGHCALTNGSNSYMDNSTIYVWVKKADACVAADDAHYEITGHL